MIYKSGDIIVRINGGHHNMKVGDMATVKYQLREGAEITLVEYGVGHADYNFRLATGEEAAEFKNKESSVNYQIY